MVRLPINFSTASREGLSLAFPCLCASGPGNVRSSQSSQCYHVNSLNSIYKAGLMLSVSLMFQRLLLNLYVEFPPNQNTSTVKVLNNRSDAQC